MTCSEAPAIRVDVASALAQGKRAAQEDAIITDFPIGAPLGMVILADGMGGHDAGDVASNLVVSAVHTALRAQVPAMAAAPQSIPEHLWSAACTANTALNTHVTSRGGTEGMGCTLIALVHAGPMVHWLSIGDSPIYLLRDGALRRLNEDHSLAGLIDDMAARGVLTAEEARTHPDRSVLTSAVTGQKIRYVDRRAEGLALRPGDRIVVASDGLTYLDERRLSTLLSEVAARPAAEISQHLLDALDRLDHPDQDNVSFAVLRVGEIGPACAHEVKGDLVVGAAAPVMTRLRSLGAGLIG